MKLSADIKPITYLETKTAENDLCKIVEDIAKAPPPR